MPAATASLITGMLEMLEKGGIRVAKMWEAGLEDELVKDAESVNLNSP